MHALTAVVIISLIVYIFWNKKTENKRFNKKFDAEQERLKNKD